MDNEEKYLLKAINAIEEKFFVISPEFKILAANLPTIKAHRSDLVGEQCHQAFYRNDSVCENCPVLKTAESHKSGFKDEKAYSPDSGNLFCLYSYPILFNDEIQSFAVFNFKIFPSDDSRKELAQSSAFLHNLILSSVDGVIAADKTGKILIFNDAASEITGYSMNEALHMLDIRDVYHKNGARDAMKKLRSKEYGGKGKLKSCKIDLRGKNGETIPISLNASIVYKGDKEVATIGFFHDMREELKMKAELEKTQVQLLQADKMSSLGKLAAGVAHQINNPLGAITLFTNLILEEYKLENGAKKDLSRILANAERCKDTVKELLEFAYHTHYRIRPYDINKAISRTLFLFEKQTLFHNIEIKLKLDKHLPDIPIDVQQINHLLMNIILNAAQAMDGNGTLTIETCMNFEEESISITISDTGPGIPEKDLPHVFEPFYTSKEEGEGTGLGLSMAYSIVENHNGEIVVDSKPGKGASFIINLPLSGGKNGEENGN